MRSDHAGRPSIDQSRYPPRPTGAIERKPRAGSTQAIGRLIRADLIAIDDIGMLPVAADAAEALFRVVDTAHETRSIALTAPRMTAQRAGENRWPPARRKHVRHGENRWPPVGRNR